MIWYLQWCKVDKGLLESTVETYRSCIEKFIDFLGEHNTHLSIATIDDIEKYWLELMDRQQKGLLAKISANDYRKILFSFYEWLVMKRITDTNHWKNITRIKVGKHNRDVLSVEQINRLIENVSAMGVFEFRDIILFELFLNSGLLTTEMSNLEVTHLHYGEESSTYQIKVLGRRSRLVPLTEGTSFRIKKYLNSRELRFPSNFVFPNTKGERLHRRLIYEIIKKFLVFTDTKKKGAQVLRYTYAASLLNNGRDVLAVQKMLGHAHVSTMNSYPNPSFEYIKSQFNKCHPKGFPGVGPVC